MWAAVRKNGVSEIFIGPLNNSVKAQKKLTEMSQKNCKTVSFYTTLENKQVGVMKKKKVPPITTYTCVIFGPPSKLLVTWVTSLS